VVGVGSAVDRIDRAQRRFPPLGVPIAVVYKFFDDQGTYLAAIITYYGFVAIFPLLLLATTWLGATLQDNPDLAQELLDSALGQFPIIGTQLGVPGGLGGSTTAVVLGTLAAVYGALGLGQAIQNATNVAWAVPRNKRPNPLLLRLKSLVLLTIGGIAVLAITVLSLLASHTEVLGVSLSSYQWPIMVATLLVNTVTFTLFFRIAAARRHSLRSAVPGALMVAALWLALQYLGTYYVQQVLASTSDLTGTFGLVLGMIGIIFIAAVIGVLGMETNVVLERRLWPRALLTPFTDVADPTEADRRAYASYVRAQRHKGYEQIDVTWTVETPVIDAEGEGNRRPGRRRADQRQRKGTNR
jgi:YihY family inner membrane protein